MPSRLLIVYHSQSGSTARIADAVIEGARDPAVEDVEVEARSPFETGPEDVLAADGLLLGTPENFGYMSGAMKDFFDRIYYPCLEQTEGKPYALFVRAGNDGTGAVTSMQRIIAGLAWREAQPPLICAGELAPATLDACRELGLTMAAGLEAGVF